MSHLRLYLIAGSILLILISGNPSNALTIDPVYKGVNAVFLDATVIAEDRLQQLLDIDKVLKDAQRYLTKQLSQFAPDIKVVRYHFVSRKYPPEAFERTTLKVLIQITLRDPLPESRQMSNVLGASAIALRKTYMGSGKLITRTLGVRSIPAEPFVASRNADLIRTQIRRVVQNQLRAAVVLPLKATRKR